MLYYCNTNVHITLLQFLEIGPNRKFAGEGENIDVSLLPQPDQVK